MKKSERYIISLILIVIFLLVIISNKDQNEKPSELRAPSLCYNSLADCNSSCNGYRCTANCSQGIQCSPSEVGCYGSQSDCQTNCSGYICQNGTCTQTSSCPSGTLGTSCWISSTECQSKCNINQSVFSKLEQSATLYASSPSSPERKFKIVNKATNAVLQTAQDFSNCGSTKWGTVNAHVLLSAADSNNPGMWWRFRKGTNGGANEYFIVSDCDTYLQCPNENANKNKEWCIDPYKYNVNDPSWMLIRLDVVDSAQGTCKLWSKNQQGFIYATGGCWGGGPSFDCYIASSTEDKGDKSIWKLVLQ